MKQCGVNHHASFCPVQQVTEVAEMSMTAANSISCTVLIQYKHLTWRKPALRNNKDQQLRDMSSPLLPPAN